MAAARRFLVGATMLFALSSPGMAQDMTEIDSVIKANEGEVGYCPSDLGVYATLVIKERCGDAHGHYTKEMSACIDDVVKINDKIYKYNSIMYKCREIKRQRQTKDLDAALGSAELAAKNAEAERVSREQQAEAEYRTGVDAIVAKYGAIANENERRERQRIERAYRERLAEEDRQRRAAIAAQEARRKAIIAQQNRIRFEQLRQQRQEFARQESIRQQNMATLNALNAFVGAFARSAGGGGSYRASGGGGSGLPSGGGSGCSNRTAYVCQ